MLTYKSIQEIVRANGDRHAARAAGYMAEGRPEYAAGSMLKAERNWRRADEMEAFLAEHWPPEMCEKVASMTAEIEKTILYGRAR